MYDAVDGAGLNGHHNERSTQTNQETKETKKQEHDEDSAWSSC